MHLKILKIYFIKEISGKGFETRPEPDIEAGNPAISGFSRITGRFLFVFLNNVNIQFVAHFTSQPTAAD